MNNHSGTAVAIYDLNLKSGAYQYPQPNLSSFHNQGSHDHYHLSSLLMPLVDYPDSEDSDDNHGKADSKTGNADGSSSMKGKSLNDPTAAGLPPLPNTFHDLYASTSRVSNIDDPGLHGGRQRAAPHVEGQWPTHVYIECVSPVWLLWYCCRAT